MEKFPSISESESTQEENKFCINCGKPLTGNGRYCSSCGYDVVNKPKPGIGKLAKTLIVGAVGLGTLAGIASNENDRRKLQPNDDVTPRHVAPEDETQPLPDVETPPQNPDKGTFI